MVSKARIHDKQGQRDAAAAQYQAILLSGYEIPPDLARYIKGRASLANQ
jgi:type IV pilus assembly protein PilQ